MTGCRKDRVTTAGAGAKAGLAVGQGKAAGHPEVVSGQQHQHKQQPEGEGKGPGEAAVAGVVGQSGKQLWQVWWDRVGSSGPCVDSGLGGAWSGCSEQSCDASLGSSLPGV